jgi:hypothetical protein
MTVTRLKELVRNLIEEIENEEEMDEATTTGNVSGYNIPQAFGKPSNEKKKGERLAKAAGYTVVNEGTNRFHQLRKEEATPNQKIGKGIREIRKQIQEMEKFIEWYSKIKTENGLDSSQYWKRTQKHLNVIRERLNKVSQKIQNLSV